MASCAYCNSTIVLGGKRAGDLRFCSGACLAKGAALRDAQRIPDDLVERTAREIHSGRCPKCHGPGPIDVFNSYQVWSAIVVTHWKTTLQVSCKRCGVKRQLGSLATTFLVGWWGFPWGLVMTPIQVFRNAVALTRTPDISSPSPALRRAARLVLVGQQRSQRATNQGIS